VYFTTIGLFLGTILAIFGMRYRSVNQRARARLAQELAYRDIATRTSADQAATATAITAIQASLADIAARLGAIERVLKEVE
jgi:HAMP domain-containing protein